MEGLYVRQRFYLFSQSNHIHTHIHTHPGAALDQLVEGSSLVLLEQFHPCSLHVGFVWTDSVRSFSQGSTVSSHFIPQIYPIITHPA